MHNFFTCKKKCIKKKNDIRDDKGGRRCVGTPRACNTCNMKTIADMVVTKKDDITSNDTRRRCVATPRARACPSRHFLPHSLFARKAPFGENLRDNPSPWPNIRPQQRKVNDITWLVSLNLDCNYELLLSELLESIFEARSQMWGPGSLVAQLYNLCIYHWLFALIISASYQQRDRVQQCTTSPLDAMHWVFFAA